MCKSKLSYSLVDHQMILSKPTNSRLCCAAKSSRTPQHLKQRKIMPCPAAVDWPVGRLKLDPQTEEDVKDSSFPPQPGWHICRKGSVGSRTQRGGISPTSRLSNSFNAAVFSQRSRILHPAGVRVPRRPSLQICHPAGVERMNFFTLSEVWGLFRLASLRSSFQSHRWIAQEHPSTSDVAVADCRFRFPHCISQSHCLAIASKQQSI